MPCTVRIFIQRLQVRNWTAEFLSFTAQTGDQGIEVRYADETVWLTPKMMAALFQVGVPAIRQHLKKTLYA